MKNVSFEAERHLTRFARPHVARARRRRLVRRKRSLPSRLLRHLLSELSTLPRWLRFFLVPLLAGFVFLSTVSLGWVLLEWAKLLGTLACAVGLVVTLLWWLGSRE